MTSIVTRPTTHEPDARRGMLHAEHFQIAYVTNDMARACDILRQRYGIRAFRTLETDLAAGGHMHVELAWCGGTMIEIIHATGAGTEFYNARLPGDGFAIRHHHLGYVVQDAAEWAALRDRIARENWPVAFEGDVDGFLRFVYIDAPELGHYLEYFLLEPEGVTFFERVPAS